jgi:hypothetical protein
MRIGPFRPPRRMTRRGCAASPPPLESLAGDPHLGAELIDGEPFIGRGVASWWRGYSSRTDKAACCTRTTPRWPFQRDTGPVPVSDIEGARAALRKADLAELLGLAECGWVDAKEGVYRLDQPAGAEELVKDVAGFANARTGGLVLVGFSTRKEHDREIIDQARPVPRALVDLDRHRKLIRERVIPPPRGVSVEWIECGDDKGVLFIDVPAQPPACLPYAVAGPTRTANVSRMSVAVPVREADATVWLPQAELQRLLAAGWSATGGPSEQLLADLIEQAVSAARREPPPTPPAPSPALRVGEGEPGWRGPFQQAWNDVTRDGTPIGDPVTKVYAEGPGVVQHFEQHPTTSGWVLCALPHQRPVAVAEEVWQALQRAGSGVPGGDALGAVGLPAPYPQATRKIDTQTVDVDLTGGQWGDGRLLRGLGEEEWRWEPAVRFGMSMTRGAGYWTAERAARQLRLRAIATLPWAEASELAIIPQRRADLEQSLPVSELAGLVTTLSLRRGAALRAADWSRGPNRNALDALSYSSLITAPDARAALAAEVMMALPSSMNSSVVTCAELRVTDPVAWAEALAASGAPIGQDVRLSLEDVAEFFIVAWQTATERLASVVTDDAPAMPWADPPTVELRLSAERRFDTNPAPQPMLAEYIDMSPLGHSDRGQVPEMAVTIIAPPRLDPSDRRTRTREALVYMAQQFGFIEASADQF